MLATDRVRMLATDRVTGLATDSVRCCPETAYRFDCRFELRFDKEVRYRKIFLVSI